MNRPVKVWMMFALALMACEASGETDGETPKESDASDASAAPGLVPFDPPPPPEGYTRIVAPIVPDIAPGQDISHCQYVQLPFDRDVDIMDVQGFQSVGGHHSIAYATTADVPEGTAGPCGDEDNLVGGFLGGVGGEGATGIQLPHGIGFRLPRGSKIMLNTHFYNYTDETIQGETVLDVHFEEADPNRQIASLFTNLLTTFQLAPQQDGHAVAECVFTQDMDLIVFANHLHEYGTHIWSELIRSSDEDSEEAAVEAIHEDPHWEYEMQFNPVFVQYPMGEPLHVRAGDTLRTHCNWHNTTDETLTFPREMCVGFGFFLSDGATSPTCINGTWIER